jgi:osmotically-inducible protein OsmY
MSRRLQIIIGASAASALALSALAQETPNPKIGGSDYPGGGMIHAQRTDRLTNGDQAVYATTNVTTEPDNTARNVRDREERTLTPLDQGNRQADIDTTAQIRKEIMAGTNMSMNARNVKIITMNGRVTLRGPVDTAEEKRLIGEIADRIAYPENVDNQLEVKTNPNN